MSFGEYFHSVDVSFLHFANLSLAHPWNDVVFKLWTSEVPWFVMTAFFFGQTAYRRQWRAFTLLLWLGATIGVSDGVAAQLIKPWVGRLRPCRIEDLVRVVDGCAGSWGFPSNHAANGAAFAVFWLLWKGPRPGLIAVACAVTVGFSRIYLGVHYPSDVIGGFCFGGSLGALSYYLYTRTLARRWAA